MASRESDEKQANSLRRFAEHGGEFEFEYGVGVLRDKQAHNARGSCT